MKEYIRAEWQLYKKSSARIVLGLILGGVYFFLQIFCPFLSAGYCSITVIIGFLSFCFLFFPLYTTGIRQETKKKSAILTENMLLCLGETKRIFLQIRFVAFSLLAVFFCCGTFLFQFLLYFAKMESFQRNNCFFTVFLLLSMIFFGGLSGLFFQGGVTGCVSGGIVGFVCGALSYELGTAKEKGELQIKITEAMRQKMLVLAAVSGAIFFLVFLAKYLLAYREEKRN